MNPAFSSEMTKRIAAGKILEAKRIHDAADEAHRALTEEETSKIFSRLDAGRELMNSALEMDWREAKAGGSPTKVSWNSLAEAVADVERMPPRMTSATGPGHKPQSTITPQQYDMPEDGSVAARSGRPARSAKFYDLFPGASKTLGGFRSPAEFWDVVGNGLAHPALRPSAAMSGQSGSSGGYIIPDPIAARLWGGAVESSILLSRVTLYPMTSDSLRIAAWDNQDTSSNDAGFAIEWLGELEEATRQTGKMRCCTLHAHKGAVFCQASNELVADGQNFEQQLTAKLQEVLAYGLDNALIRGDGAGKPLGILSSPCLISVGKESGQAADTFLFENAVKMFTRLRPGSVARAIWLMHPSVLEQALQMTLGIGASGAWMPVLDQSNGSLSLLSRPVILTEKCSALGDKGDVILCDPTAILAGVRAEISIERSTVPGWLTDATDWRCITRFDAQPALSQAYQGPRGSTLSPFVTLDARA